MLSIGTTVRLWRPWVHASGRPPWSGLVRAVTTCVRSCGSCVGKGIGRASASDDWYFTAPSSVTYHMQHVVLAGVMADAAMVDRAMDADIIHPVDPGRPPRDGWRDIASAAARLGGRPAAREGGRAA